MVRLWYMANLKPWKEEELNRLTLEGSTSGRKQEQGVKVSSEPGFWEFQKQGIAKITRVTCRDERAEGVRPEKKG